jgi:TP901 family phage tail tape measure protein
MPGAIRFDLIANTTRWSRGFQEAERTSSRFGARLRLAVVGGAAAAAGGVAALAAAAVGLNKEWDDATDSIRVGTGKTGKALQGLTKDFKTVARTSPDDLQLVADAITKLNVRTGQTGKGLQALAKQELNLARITKTDLGENIAASTRLFRDWSVPTHKQAGALDEMFRASQATGAGVTDLMTLVVQFGSPLRQLGFNLEQTTALFGEFERAGVVTETVLPGLKIALKNYALAHKDPQQALIETIKRIKEASTTAQANTIAFKTFGARAGPDLAAAIREGHFDLQNLIDTIKGGHDTIASAERDTAGWAEAWKKFSNTIKVELGPTVTSIFDGLGNLLNTKVTPALQSVKGWWDRNKTSVGDLADLLRDRLSPQVSTLATNVQGLMGDLGKLSGVLRDAGAWNTLITMVSRTGEEINGLISIFRHVVQFITVSVLGIQISWIKLQVAWQAAVRAFIDGAIKIAQVWQALAHTSDTIFHTHLGRSADQAVANMQRMRGGITAEIEQLKQQAAKKMDEMRRAIGKPARATVDVKGTVHWDKNAALLKELTGNFTHKLPAQPFAAGGLVTQGTGPTADDVWGRLSRGEFVVNAQATKAIGVENLRQLNAMRFAVGGLVPQGPFLGLKGTVFSADKDATRTMLRNAASLHGADAMALLMAAGFGGMAGVGPMGPASGNVIRLALGQAKRMAASFKVALALMEAGIVESGLRNLPYGDRDSLGFLQQRPSQGWAHPMNITYAAWDFLRRAIPIQGRYGTAGQLAQAVQRSAFPGRYDQQQARALGILHAYGYDRGGLLPPGLSLAWNGTGRPERVGRAGATVNIHKGAVQAIFNGPVDAATIPQVHGMLDDAFSEFTQLLQVKLGG